MRQFKWYIVSTIIFLITLAFLGLGMISSTSYAQETTSNVSVAQLGDIHDGTTPTPTPFQPLPPTPTYLPEEKSLSSSSKPTQAEDDTIKESAPAPKIPPGSRFNLLLLGSDQRPYEGGFRTDTIILVSLDPSEGKASLVSFPRDLYVTIPGWMEQRINTAIQM